MGVKTPQLFDLLGIPHETLEPDGLDATLERLLSRMEEAFVPGALLVRPGMIA